LRNDISAEIETNLVVSCYSPIFYNMFVSQASFRYMPHRYSPRIIIVYLLASETKWRLSTKNLFSTALNTLKDTNYESSRLRSQRTG